jgi:hypothetical protein
MMNTAIWNSIPLTQVDRAVGGRELATRQRQGTDEDPHAVEDIVEPAAEDRPGPLQASDLAVHAVEDEAPVVEDGSDNSAYPSTFR